MGIYLNPKNKKFWEAMTWILRDCGQILYRCLEADVLRLIQAVFRMICLMPHAGKPALVIELKYDKSVSSAVQQIKERSYTQALEGYAGEILLVAVNYDKDNPNKPHSCVIEKAEMAASEVPVK